MLLSTAHAETIKESCMFHSWKGMIGNAPVFIEFEDYLSDYHTHFHVGHYFTLPALEYYGLTDVNNLPTPQNKQGRTSQWPENDNLVDKWQTGTGEFHPGLGRETFTDTGTLDISCTRDVMSGQWESLDGKITLPVHAEVAKASFDCEKASSNIEKLICGDQQLSALDSKLEIFYKATLAKYSTDEANMLKEDQNKWLKNARGICDDISCLKQTYEYRIYEFSKNDHFHRFKFKDIFLNGITVNTWNHTAIQDGEKNQRNKSFNSDIKKGKLEGKIVQCNILVYVPTGVRDGEIGYGGICSLSIKGKLTKVMICNDDMVGHFKMDKIDHEISKQELVNFIVSNCYGG